MEGPEREQTGPGRWARAALAALALVAGPGCVPGTTGMDGILDALLLGTPPSRAAGTVARPPGGARSPGASLAPADSPSPRGSWSPATSQDPGQGAERPEGELGAPASAAERTVDPWDQFLAECRGDPECARARMQESGAASPPGTWDPPDPGTSTGAGPDPTTVPPAEGSDPATTGSGWHPPLAWPGSDPSAGDPGRAGGGPGGRDPLPGEVSGGEIPESAWEAIDPFSREEPEGFAYRVGPPDPASEAGLPAGA